MIALMLATAAWSAEPTLPAFDASHARVAVDGDETLWTATSAVDAAPFATMSVGWANQPVIYAWDNGAERYLVRDAVTMDLAAGATIAGRLRVAAGAPFVLLANGTEAHGGGLGDAWLGAKAELLSGDTGPIGLAIDGRVGLPTSTAAAPYGEAGASGEIAAVADRRLGRLLLAGNVGVRATPGADLGNVVLDEQPFARVGGAWSVTERLSVTGDLGGRFAWGEPLGNPAALPAEVLGGVRWAVPESGAVVRAGLGTGIGRGVGAPQWRGLVAVTFRPIRPEATQADVGVEDPGVQVAPLLPPVIEVVLRPEAPAPLAPVEPVHFAFDDASVPAGDAPRLEQAAAQLVARPEVRVRLEGHTDVRGREVYNQWLSEARAEAVRDFLVARGVAAERCEIVGFGETRPLAAGHDEASHAMNRRVDVILVEPEREEAPAVAAH